MVKYLKSASGRPEALILSLLIIPRFYFSSSVFFDAQDGQEEQDEQEEQELEQELESGQPMHLFPLFFALIMYNTAPPIMRAEAIIAIISPSVIIYLCRLSE